MSLVRTAARQIIPRYLAKKEYVAMLTIKDN